jgi:hypothetical protein
LEGEALDLDLKNKDYFGVVDLKKHSVLVKEKLEMKPRN